MLVVWGGSVAGFGQKSLFFTSEKELSSSLINAVYQDSRNYIWIATEDGLNRYDGNRFTVYKNAPDDEHSLRNNYTRCMFEDSRGRFWVGCINALQLYNRNTDNFSEIVINNDSARIFPHITSVIESRDKEIWITTSGEGVIRIREDTVGVRSDTRLTNKLSSRHLTSIMQDSQGRFWIGSENNGVNLYNPENDSVTVFKAPFAIGDNQISSVCEDADGKIFVGTLTDGLYVYNAEKEMFERVEYESKTSLPVKCLTFDIQNRLLVGCDGEGIKIYNPQRLCLEDFKVKSAPFDFSRMKVHAICIDRMGNIWTGLFQKGVFLEPANRNDFYYWGNRSPNQGLIGSDCVMSLLKDRRGNLWIGTDNDGVYRIAAYGGEKHFTDVPNTVLSLLEDDNGNVWLGSYGKGLACIEQESEVCHYYDYADDSTHSVVANTAQNKIFALAKDCRNRIWTGTNGAGIYIFDIAGKRFIANYSQYSTDSAHIPNDWINCIIEDSRHLIWAGSYNGFFSINPSNGEVRHYSTQTVVYCIKEDTFGNLWVGTAEGLTYFNITDEKSVSYTVADGLPSNVICDVQCDDDGNVWFSTHSGISKFLPEEQQFVNFYSSDGLQSNEFSLGASFKAPDGMLYFGGVNGITSFYPADINIERTPPSLYLTDLTVMNKHVVAGQKSGRNEIFTGFIADVDTIRLNYKDNIFTLEFSTFYFGSSEHVDYYYFMEGLSEQWMSTGVGNNRLSFTNLKYGSHQLKIKASIYDSYSDEKELVIIITPPWSLTWWAKIIWFALAALLILGVYFFIADRNRHRTERLRSEHAEQINESKLQFFINISHDIRTPMTLIIGPLEKLIAENKVAALQKVYLLMYRNAKRILQLINQLMDVRKLDRGLMSVKMSRTNITEFITDIMQTFEFQAEKKHLRFDFLHPSEEVEAYIDRNNFDKVIVNVLSNAFKFTPDNGAITVSLTTGCDPDNPTPLGRYFEIIVADTGQGIEEDKIEKIFERFYQIENKANYGTGIGLHLARSFAELQYGRIWARNRKDRQGSEFVIRMPLGNKHLKPSEIDTSEVDWKPVAAEGHKAGDIVVGDDVSDVTKQQALRPKTKYRLLIADDDVDVREYLRSELADTFRITEANDGKEALNLIFKEKPDLVLSDVMMPEIDGLTLARKIKTNININHIPVILLTARSEEPDIVEGIETGADAYITKPFNIDLLKKQIINLIENRARLEPKISAADNAARIRQPALRPSDDVLYEKIIRLVNDNISDSNLNAEFLAKNVGMSRVHIHRKLKELTNQSARDFIRNIRLKQAADMLKNKKLTISDIAYSLGFINLSHFSTSFREFYGLSPKEFRDKNDASAET
jgi:ligand-binding sensor domain-containing protein/signal transduction histidine kinase/CheY-like chemotaxis protein/AraC-like DNA-binding protein